MSTSLQNRRSTYRWRIVAAGNTESMVSRMASKLPWQTWTELMDRVRYLTVDEYRTDVITRTDPGRWRNVYTDDHMALWLILECQTKVSDSRGWSPTTDFGVAVRKKGDGYFYIHNPYVGSYEAAEVMVRMLGLLEER